MSVGRGRAPIYMLKVAKLLTRCNGWENGITIDEIAEQIYGKTTPHNKQKARLLIGAVRRTLNVDIFSIKTVGETERRYCHLVTEAEYTKAINDFIKHISGSEKTKAKLEKAKIVIPAKQKLEAVRTVKTEQ